MCESPVLELARDPSTCGILFRWRELDSEVDFIKMVVILFDSLKEKDPG